MAHAMYQKYANAVPLYRQETDWAQYGLPLSRGRLARWIQICSEDYFLPVYAYLHRLLLQRKFLMADETRIQGNRSIIPRYRKVVVPGTHTAENHDFISPDQGSRSSISKSLRCATRSGNTLSR